MTKATLVKTVVETKEDTKRLYRLVGTEIAVNPFGFGDTDPEETTEYFIASQYMLEITVIGKLSCSPLMQKVTLRVTSKSGEYVGGNLSKIRLICLLIKGILYMKHDYILMRISWIDAETYGDSSWISLEEGIERLRPLLPPCTAWAGYCTRTTITWLSLRTSVTKSVGTSLRFLFL